MTDPSIVMVAEGRSVRGQSHEDNEDAWQVYFGDEPETNLLAVIADGVSSVAGGKLASTLACERFEEFLSPGHDARLESLVQLVAEIDWELRGQEEVSACTLSALWVSEGTASIVAVGDSPVFLFRRRELSRVVGEASRGFLKSFMGMGSNVVERVEVSILDVQAGDVFILATDGVSELLGESVMQSLWEGNPGSQACADAIVSAVLQRRGEDDATVVVVQAIAPGVVLGGPQDVPEPPPHLRP